MVCNHWSCGALRCVSSVALRGDQIEVLVLAFLLLIIAVALLMYAVRIRSIVEKQKKSFGIPDGLILYSDLNVPAAPLFSPRCRLSGKPDYIIRRGNHLIPVEVKTGQGSHPHQSQVLQLAAYCQILEDTTGGFVPEGILVYNTVPYSISFNPKLRFELESIMKTMRASLRSGSVQRNHNEPQRCYNCSMKRSCTDKVPYVP